MRYLKTFVIIVLTVALVGLAEYINNDRAYSLEEMSAFVASCGSFIQSTFKSNKPGTPDYFVVLVSVVVVLSTLWFSVKYLINPSEQKDHIKFKILENEKECKNISG